MLCLSLIFRISLSKAVKSALTLGIGFIGIFIIFDFFVENIGPAVKLLVARTGLNFHVLDVGWTPLASITWSYKLAPVLMVAVMLLNGVLLMLRWTKTVNIDIWNYWHFIFTGAIMYETTHSLWHSACATLLISVITLKLADWSAPAVKKFSGLSGISISTLSGVGYFPLGYLGNKLLDKVPVVNRMNADPAHIKARLGIAGEPMMLGFIMGAVLGIGASYEIKAVLELAFSIAAVIYILPMMAGILGQGLLPLSEGLQQFMNKRFPKLGETYIGLDLAVVLGDPSIMVTALFLMPVALFLSFALPGVSFIPLGDLANIIGAICMVVVATRGNIIRAFIISVPILIGKLYAATWMAALYTRLAAGANFHFEGYEGLITSFLDGGNLVRYWMFRLFEGKLWALAALPPILVLVWLTRKAQEEYL